MSKPSKPQIFPGTVFSTLAESGCVATTAPDEDGNFDARDSDGVVCSFWLGMVESTEGVDRWSRSA